METTEEQAALAPVLARLNSLSKLYQTQLTGMEELQRTLDEDIAGVLHQLEQRPLVDVASITTRLDQAIDAVDRVRQQRIPRLVSRRWWVPWLWLLTGLVVGVLCAYWTLETPRGRHLRLWLWPQQQIQPSAPALKRK